MTMVVTFIAEPAMIVVPEVTLARMQDAIERLFQNGFCDSLRSEFRNPESGPHSFGISRFGPFSRRALPSR